MSAYRSIFLSFALVPFILIMELLKLQFKNGNLEFGEDFFFQFEIKKPANKSYNPTSGKRYFQTAFMDISSVLDPSRRAY